MPQAARAGPRAQPAADKDVARARDQEFKRAKGAISCAECRRLKLKCDKTIPCSSCRRRGCASICPNGCLVTGQGTRFILADTDRLHRKIEDMSDRIRQLEDALSILQSAVDPKKPHPLLAREFLSIKSGLQLHAALQHGSPSSPDEGTTKVEQADDPLPETEASESIDAFGTLAVRDDGVATFYGRSAGSESLLLDEKADRLEAPAVPITTSSSPIAALAATTFPLPTVARDIDDIRDELESYLPEWTRARELCELYLEQAPWFFGALTRRQLWEEVLPLFYPEAAAAEYTPPPDDVPPSASSSSSTTLTVASSATAFGLSPSASSSQPPQATPHDLALMFVVFCFGALTDPTLPPAPHNEEANNYYDLTRAALNLQPVFDRPPSVATVQTLSLMGIYQGLVADENSIESTWSLMGMSCKLAQSIGLHRDCARWKLSPAEVQKRRALFWELFITDCWQGLATGRLPTFALPYVDTELPADPDQMLDKDGVAQPSFPAWKAMWGKECVAGVVEVTLQARAPKYSLILELDRKIRDTQLPGYTEGEAPKGASLGETMQHFMPINYRELTLLYVHRCFFAQALADFPTDPMRSEYAPSFLAGYRSACSLISTVREQFGMFPVQIARFWVLWTHAFSSTVMLASVVTHGGTTKTAQAAFGELRQACELFEKAAPYGGRAVKFLPIIKRLYDKAFQALSEGLHKLGAKDLFAPRESNAAGGGGEQMDELAVFSGRTRTVATKAARHHGHGQKSRRSLSRKRASPADSPASASTASAGGGGGGGSGGGESERSSQSPAASGSASASVSESPRGPAEETSLPPTAPIASVSLPALDTYGGAVHPMLVDGMRSFESELEGQISRAQREWEEAQAQMQSQQAQNEEQERVQVQVQQREWERMEEERARQERVIEEERARQVQLQQQQQKQREMEQLQHQEARQQQRMAEMRPATGSNASGYPFAPQAQTEYQYAHQHHSSASPQQLQYPDEQQPQQQEMDVNGHAQWAYSAVSMSPDSQQSHSQSPPAQVQVQEYVYAQGQGQAQYEDATGHYATVSAPVYAEQYAPQPQAQQQYQYVEQDTQGYVQEQQQQQPMWNVTVQAPAQAQVYYTQQAHPQQAQQQQQYVSPPLPPSQVQVQVHYQQPPSAPIQQQQVQYAPQVQIRRTMDPRVPSHSPPTQYHPQQSPPQQQPQQSVLPVHAGVYSLQETWTSFMQQALPGMPGMGPGARQPQPPPPPQMQVQQPPMQGVSSGMGMNMGMGMGGGGGGGGGGVPMQMRYAPGPGYAPAGR